MQATTVTGIHPLILTQFQRDCERLGVPYTVYAKDTLDGQLYRYVQYSLLPVDNFDIPSLEADKHLIVTAIEGKYERALVVRFRRQEEVIGTANYLRKETERAAAPKHNANDASEAVSPALKPTND